MNTKHYRFAALLLVSFGWFHILAGRLGLSTLLLPIEEHLSIGHTEAGLALSAMWLLYGLMQFPSGIISDIKGRKLTLLLSMILFSLAYFLVGFSSHYYMFFIALLILGIGSGGYQTAGIAMLTDLFTKGRGRALGIQSSAGSLSGLIPMVASLIAMYYWKGFFYLWALLGFLGSVLFLLYTRESTTLPSKVSYRERIIDGIRVLRQREILVIFVANLVMSITWIGYMSFFPTYLIEGKSFSPLLASIALTILMSGSILVRPFIGSLSDRYDKLWILLLLMGLVSFASFILIFSHDPIVILTMALVLSFTGGTFPVFSSYLMDQWEEKGRGGKLGFYRSLIILCASPISAIIGTTASSYNFTVPFLGMAVLVIIGVLVVMLKLLWRSRGVASK